MWQIKAALNLRRVKPAEVVPNRRSKLPKEARVILPPNKRHKSIKDYDRRKEKEIAEN